MGDSLRWANSTMAWLHRPSEPTGGQQGGACIDAERAALFHSVAGHGENDLYLTTHIFPIVR